MLKPQPQNVDHSDGDVLPRNLIRSYFSPQSRAGLSGQVRTAPPTDVHNPGAALLGAHVPLSPSHQPSPPMSDTSSAEEAHLHIPASSAPSTADSVKSFLAGGFGGVAAVLVGHPFDLIKTRLQTASPGTYTGAVDAVRKTVARDGAAGLYRGVVPPLLGVTPMFAVSFWAYDMSKALILAVTPKRTSQELSIPELATAGFLSAIPTTIVTAPVERAKVLLQVQGQGQSGKQFTGVFDVVKHLYREGGIRSVYRGSAATIWRDGPGNAAYFAAYEVTKKLLTPAGSSPSELNLGAIVIAGGTAGVAMWSIAIPPDVLKSRIQSAPTGTYSGFLDCARKTIAADGVGALWKGLGPAMARAFPANAATFVGVEFSRQLMDKYF
ncbi:Mitochondrial carnitine carrier [Sparassis crispa]|uniref:Mitochondrial carnitine carrier n=1 Tax=Sparassis crispa TaxID=139825 RepID=A0A401G7X1_9APHY|nr:Mitochondrial carnitine carrier [Sparassis crispa]GBE78249.1 Mitochondrial carnitine carrier [Sparassis crispa]